MKFLACLLSTFFCKYVCNVKSGLTFIKQYGFSNLGFISPSNTYEEKAY